MRVRTSTSGGIRLRRLNENSTYWKTVAFGASPDRTVSKLLLGMALEYAVVGRGNGPAYFSTTTKSYFLVSLEADETDSFYRYMLLYVDTAPQGRSTQTVYLYMGHPSDDDVLNRIFEHANGVLGSTPNRDNTNGITCPVAYV